MTLFDTYGHLTQQALDAWAEGSLCTEQRLLVAEHLSVCDDCLLRMTLLELPETPQPEADLVKPAIRKVRERRTLDVLKRCGIVAAAACFGFLSWHFKLFEGREKPLQPVPTQASALQVLTTQLSDGLFGWGMDLSETLQGTFERDDNHETTQRSDDHE